MEDHSQDVIDKTKLECSEEQGKYEVWRGKGLRAGQRRPGLSCPVPAGLSLTQDCLYARLSQRLYFRRCGGH